jgi:hypothetical protein
MMKIRQTKEHGAAATARSNEHNADRASVRPYAVDVQMCDFHGAAPKMTSRQRIGEMYFLLIQSALFLK